MGDKKINAGNAEVDGGILSRPELQKSTKEEFNNVCLLHADPTKNYGMTLTIYDANGQVDGQGRFIRQEKANFGYFDDFADNLQDVLKMRPENGKITADFIPGQKFIVKSYGVMEADYSQQQSKDISLDPQKLTGKVGGQTCELRIQ